MCTLNCCNCQQKSKKKNANESLAAMKKLRERESTKRPVVICNNGIDHWQNKRKECTKSQWNDWYGCYWCWCRSCCITTGKIKQPVQGIKKGGFIHLQDKYTPAEMFIYLFFISRAFFPFFSFFECVCLHLSPSLWFLFIRLLVFSSLWFPLALVCQPWHVLFCLFFELLMFLFAFISSFLRLIRTLCDRSSLCSPSLSLFLHLFDFYQSLWLVNVPIVCGFLMSMWNHARRCFNSLLFRFPNGISIGNTIVN